MEKEQSQEHIKGPEHSVELAEAAREAVERIHSKPEKSGENQAEKLEAAREAIEKHAETKPPAEAEKEAPKKHHPTRLDKRASYWQTVHAMQRRLKGPARKFSKVIHTPAVESASEVLGKTVFRPSVTLGATSTALFVGTFFYLTAKRYGFVLTGSEFLVALIVGGVLGGLVEAVSRFFRK